MSLKAIKIIIKTEEEARQAELTMEQKSQLALEETENAGKAAIEATLKRAEAETAHLMSITDEKATEAAKALAAKTANRQAMLRARAERLLEAAADSIVERIVNG